MILRRRVLGFVGGLSLAVALPAARALTADRPEPPVTGWLDGGQSDRFRAWMAFIVADQIRRGPSPRWYHRDCAGLARFAVAEALRPHDLPWRRANGLAGRRLPPEPGIAPAMARSLSAWTAVDGSRQAFVTALPLIQNNSRLLGRDSAQARPGDLLFFDQGDDQHLMIWMGNWIAYHTGQAPNPAISPQDNGLRAVTPAQLLQWKDTRWRPRDDNPNFAGFYRLAFLSR